VKNQRVERIGKLENSRGKLEKNGKIGVEKTSINDLEEVKSVGKCQCGKKRDKFPWKNIIYLVVAEVSDYGCFYMLVLACSTGSNCLQGRNIKWHQE
jgi:hypothetical protein